jgi:D-alanyl-D-alanine carboxypeptidase (penicillin-binding protein 5/6)
VLRELAIIIFVFLSQGNISFTEENLTGSVLGLSDFEFAGSIVPLGLWNRNAKHSSALRLHRADATMEPANTRGLTNGNQLYSAPALSQVSVSDNNNFEVEAKSAIAMDAETGAIAYEKNIQEKMPIASLTKLMTALVVLDKVDLESQVIISRNAVAAEGNKGNLKVDEKITVRNLLYLLLVNSSNDAAVALAEHIAGSEDKFTGIMNKKAKALNLMNTQFANPTGLDEDGNYSTAYDLAKLAKHILDKPLLLEIIRIQSSDVFSVDGINIHHLSNTNKLLGKLPGINIIGGKTGFTNQAGECLILAASRPENNQRVVFVILGSDDRFGEMEELVEWIW